LTFIGTSFLFFFSAAIARMLGLTRKPVYKAIARSEDAELMQISL
jgi:hypothetical protein